MLNKFIIVNLLLTTMILASAPAKPGVIPSDQVIQQTAIMSESYTQGGLAQKMQRIKAANIRNAENGSRELREDVYMSFPVLMGSYSDYDDLDTVATLLQRELFDGDWPSITLSEHYAQMSYGQFHVSGNVHGWYQMANNSEYYEGSQSEPYDNGLNVGDFIQETLQQADLEVDFRQYDSDGPDGVPNSGDDDGYVDVVMFVHSGRGGEGGGPYVWSHRWVYEGWWGNAFQTDDMGANGSPIRISDYTIQPALSVSGNGMIEIGVFSHEFGHALGLPDLYDTDYSSNGVGSWCLMASGSWSSPTSPTHMSAWCKEMLGWVIPVLPEDNVQQMEFPNVEENPFVLKLWTNSQVESFSGGYGGGRDIGREYYLVENRQHIGTEGGIPGTGLIIWHIDNTIYTNRFEEHRMVDVIAADGVFNGSNSGDPWPGSSNNRNFDFDTTPPAIGWDGENTEVAILNVSDSDSTMTADVEIHEATPHLSIIDMAINEVNQDNIFAPGEFIELWLVLENVGATANNLTATLSVPGGGIDILNETIYFEPIDFLDMGVSSGAFEFIVSDTISPQASTFEITFNADELADPDPHELIFMLGWPQVALVDDDGASSGDDDFQSYYQDALIAAGVVSVVWDIAEEGIPSFAWLQDKPQVIWYTGNNDTPLNDLSTSLMSTYLNGGGQMLLSGQHIASDDENVQELLSQFFAAERMPEDINSIFVYGDPSHDMINVEDRFTVGSASGAANQTSPDGFNVLEGGASLFVYPFMDNTASGVSKKTASYSSIVLGFGLEALSPFGGDAVYARGSLMQRMLEWLDADYVSVVEETISLPGTAGITSAYPNPFNPSISFNINMVAGAKGQIQILNLRGAVVETFEVSGSGLYAWQPDARHAGGVYFMRLMMNGETTGQLKKLTYLK